MIKLSAAQDGQEIVLTADIDGIIFEGGGYSLPEALVSLAEEVEEFESRK